MNRSMTEPGRRRPPRLASFAHALTCQSAMAVSNGTRVLTGIGAVIVINAATAILMRGEPRGRAEPLDLGSPRVTRAPPIEAELRLAVAPFGLPERTHEACASLAAHLASETGRAMLVVQRDDPVEVLELLREGGAQTALLGAGAYLSARRDGLRIHAVAVPVHAHGPVHHALIVARSDGSVRGVEDLAGRRFAFTDPLSITGYHHARRLRLEDGRTLDEVVIRTPFTHGHGASLRAVLRGTVDAAAVDGAVLDLEARRSPDLRDRLRVIHRSEAFGVGPLAALDDIDEEVEAALRRALLSMRGSADGRAALRRLGATGFEAPTPGHFDAAARAAELAGATAGRP